ncbi:sugar ABC transporter ATP-binding protein [Streptomyces phyllanthi]|uniref:Sugar ABC transporter ATP-binding protein n=1 Tax=Streptomyces phyllanthi TaxID=1803180 RepID=A0A5N8VUA3_9ACTN|nr:sugar ABC transporter ATP-binding protein [Streptomyces phyllanthi]MPY38833.1 sugar ABC transporter ATP-binding protein [Streptomyces phyllanthi]
MNVLETSGVHRSYGGVVALRPMDFSVAPGTVHALLGENGAGKSTLVKILAGAVEPDGGRILLDGVPVRFSDTADAARHGVAVVSQELNLFPDLDVLANLFTKRERLRRGVLFDRRAMAARAEPVLAELGLDVPLRAPVGELTLAQRQLVEIAKALLTEPRVLILDEPTSALDDSGSRRLLDVLDVLRRRQVAVVFVSHLLEEVMQLSDQVTILRDGQVVMAGADRAGLTIDGIVRAMLGDKLLAETELASHTQGPAPDPAPHPASAPASAPPSAAGLEVHGVTVPGVLDGVSLTARVGEIVGLAGVAGAGHQALLEVISGVRTASAAKLRLPHRASAGAPPRSLRQAVRRGVAVVSGDRRLGLMPDKPIWQNVAQVRSVALARDGALLRRSELRRRAADRVARLAVRTSGVEQPAGLLSGGNQQKVVLAKWLEAAPSTLLLDDPTRGVDVGAKAEMHELIRHACGDAAVLLCSTDLDELTSLCHRVLVFRRGRVAAELSGPELNRHRLLTEMNTAD